MKLTPEKWLEKMKKEGRADEEGICNNCRASIFFDEDILPDIEDFAC
jgi:hypothetical protein